LLESKGKTGVRLKNWSETRIGGAYECLSRFFQVYDELNQVLLDNNKHSLTMDTDKQFVLMGTLRALEGVNLFMRLLGGVAYPTIPLYFYSLQKGFDLFFEYAKTSTDDACTERELSDDVGRSLKKFVDEFKKSQNKKKGTSRLQLTSLHFASVYLCPATRTLLNDDEEVMAKQEIGMWVDQFYRSADRPASPAKSAEDIVEALPESHKRKQLQCLLATTVAKKKARTVASTLDEELELYESICDNEEFDVPLQLLCCSEKDAEKGVDGLQVNNPMEWWLQQKSKLPRLLGAAEFYVMLPVSELDCERVYSKGRKAMPYYRASSKTETVEGIILASLVETGNVKVD
jgi:hypothetical protein